MEQQANGSLRLVMSGIALAVSLSLGATAFGQATSGQGASQRGHEPSRQPQRQQRGGAAADQHRRADGQDPERSDRAPEHGELRGGASRSSPR